MRNSHLRFVKCRSRRMPIRLSITEKRHTLEYLRSISHLRPRTDTFQAVFRVRSQIAYAIHKFFQERDFVYVHTPLITGQDCEGAGDVPGNNDGSHKI